MPSAKIHYNSLLIDQVAVLTPKKWKASVDSARARLGHL